MNSQFRLSRGAGDCILLFLRVGDCVVEREERDTEDSSREGSSREIKRDEFLWKFKIFHLRTFIDHHHQQNNNNK